MTTENMSEQKDLPRDRGFWFAWQYAPAAVVLLLKYKRALKFSGRQLLRYENSLDESYRGLAIAAISSSEQDPQAAVAAGMIDTQLSDFEIDRVEDYKGQRAIDQDLESLSLGNEYRVRLLESQISENEALNRRYEIELEGSRRGLKQVRIRFRQLGLQRLRLIFTRDRYMHAAQRQYGSPAGHQAMITGIDYAKQVASHQNALDDARGQIMTLSDPIKQKLAAIAVSCHDTRQAEKEIKSITRLGSRKERRLVRKQLKINRGHGDLKKQVAAQHLASGRKIAAAGIQFTAAEAVYTVLNQDIEDIDREKKLIEQLREVTNKISQRHVWLGLAQILIAIGLMVGLIIFLIRGKI